MTLVRVNIYFIRPDLHTMLCVSDLKTLLLHMGAITIIKIVSNLDGITIISVFGFLFQHLKQLFISIHLESNFPVWGHWNVCECLLIQTHLCIVYVWLHISDPCSTDNHVKLKLMWKQLRRTCLLANFHVHFQFYAKATRHALTVICHYFLLFLKPFCIILITD